MPTLSKVAVAKCQCGCGESLPAERRRSQKYLPGHRFAAYEVHRCPECGVTHRKGVAK